mmetsp:Transcript_1189/g.2393  ORF Transcript_1189/g.2393 Transcript_1189/m.2393 type:complete len:228 (+) Transcript_1189:276-959(+)
MTHLLNPASAVPHLFGFRRSLVLRSFLTPWATLRNEGAGPVVAGGGSWFGQLGNLLWRQRIQQAAFWGSSLPVLLVLFRLRKLCHQISKPLLVFFTFEELHLQSPFRLLAAKPWHCVLRNDLATQGIQPQNEVHHTAIRIRTAQAQLNLHRLLFTGHTELAQRSNGCRGIMSNRQVIIQIQHDQDSEALVHEAILLQSHLFRGPLGPELLVGIQLIPGRRTRIRCAR